MSRWLAVLSLLLFACPPDDGLVPVQVRRYDTATECWVEVEEQWPEEYWTLQSENDCQYLDIQLYLWRDGECYEVPGSCDGIFDDPLVTTCETLGPECCVQPGDFCRPD